MTSSMRNFSILLLAILCSGCSLRAHDIQQAPPKQNKAVVFDIDGTLTPKKLAFSTARDDATTAAQLFADNGYLIIYLTARRRSLQSGIPGWLKRKGFPEGNIQVSKKTDSKNHAVYKKRVLREFQENGWNLFAAYGDKSTDFEAYSAVGIDKSRIFALQVAGKDSCEPGVWAKCLKSWSEHIDQIADMVRP